jgi:UDP-glucose 4-epimerase
LLNLIVGGCGFIGTKLCTRLLNENQKVIVIDDLSNSIPSKITHPNYSLIDSDINLDFYQEKLYKILATMSSNREKITLWHLAANSDIKKSQFDPGLELEKTLRTTLSVINISRHVKVKKIIFSSSSAVYGYKPGEILTEDISDCNPISNYGIFKYASELILLNSYKSLVDQLVILRFPNVVGFPTTHGLLYDVFKKISFGDTQINILGNGFQQKQYLGVENLINAMLLINNLELSNHEIINIAPDDKGINIRQIMNELNLRIGGAIQFNYGEEEGGWIGDVPSYVLSNLKLKTYGWGGAISSQTEIIEALDQFVNALNSD